MTLRVQAQEYKYGGLQPRPNTKVTITSITATHGDWIDPIVVKVGEVTTDYTGYAYLTVPITSVKTGPAFSPGWTYFEANTNAPLNYEALSDAVNTEYVFIQQGTVKIESTLVSQSGALVKRKYTARLPGTNLPVVGLELTGPCVNAYTDATGSFTCEYDESWNYLQNFKAAYGHAWKTVY